MLSINNLANSQVSQDLDRHRIDWRESARAERMLNPTTAKESAIQIISGVTSITVTPDKIPARGDSTHPLDRTAERLIVTGARVTVEFVTRMPLPPAYVVRILYDLAENCQWRECIGVPVLMYATHADSDNAVYHYRQSHWIAASHLMRFVAGV
jgi:hypothetical protein